MLPPRHSVATAQALLADIGLEAGGVDLGTARDRAPCDAAGLAVIVPFDPVP